MLGMGCAPEPTSASQRMELRRDNSAYRLSSAGSTCTSPSCYREVGSVTIRRAWIPVSPSERQADSRNDWM